MSEQPQQRNRIKLEIPANLRAVYANFAIIAHTGTEFFVDFAQLLPGMNKSQVHTRVVMSPTHAKMLYRALGENLERYEAKHGEVNVPPSLADQLFGSVKPEDEVDDDTPEDADE
jgi:hypothetical protein